MGLMPDWKEYARSKVFNKLAFIGQEGINYLEQIVLPYIESEKKQSYEKGLEIGSKDTEAYHRGLEKFADTVSARERFAQLKVLKIVLDGLINSPDIKVVKDLILDLEYENENNN